MDDSPRPSSTAAATHAERLWPGPLGWAIVLGFGVLGGITLLPVHPGLGLAGALVFLAGAAVAAYLVSTRVEVRDGELRAGPAHIPVDLLGAGTALDRDGVRSALGPGSDARAFVCVRSWVPGAVVLEVVDPQDPTPTWLVSSRRPRDLLAAVDAARTRAV